MGRLPPDDHRGRDDVVLQEERIMVGCACDTLHSVLHITSLMVTCFYK
jgi:hypothetical protein